MSVVPGDWRLGWDHDGPHNSRSPCGCVSVWWSPYLLTFPRCKPLSPSQYTTPLLHPDPRLGRVTGDTSPEVREPVWKPRLGRKRSREAMDLDSFLGPEERCLLRLHSGVLSESGDVFRTNSKSSTLRKTGYRRPPPL